MGFGGADGFHTGSGGGGGGTLTGADNGLSLSGTVVQLGGALIQPTLITALGANTFDILTSYGLIGIGSIPSVALDIQAIGSGTVGINLNTASTQDAKLHFRTNNAATARSQIYLEDATQTLNVYTVNNDTIFWNGNGLAQTKTLTLFTNTTAKFESNVGIAVNVDPSSRLTINGIDNTIANYAFKANDFFGNPLLYINNAAKVSIGKTISTTTLDVQGDTVNPLFKLNNSNFLFADKLRVDNIGSFYSGSINGFGAFGTGNFTTDHLNYTINTSFSTFLAITNAGGAGNKTSYGIIGGAIGSADSDYRLVILNSDTSTVSGSGLKVLSTGISSANDGFDYFNYGVNIISNGAINNIGAGTFYKVGLRVDVSNGDVNYAALFNGGNSGFGILNPLAQVHVKGVDSTTLVNQRLEPVTNVTEDTTGATVNTTDATVTPLQTIAIPTDTVVMIESRITCRKTAGAGVGTVGQGNGYIRTVKAKNVAGVVTIGVIQSSFTSEDIGVFNATFAVSGTNIVLNITGSANNDVTWNTITKQYKVA